ncbi:MAG TPA: response regulator [Nitrospirae bacterium]|nr:transcriptional regulatory protein ZraR [bacterium BMS3Abin06]HDH12433.1 response regulator [Nitrospirota bacterium]HDZ02430.1 response regulator [Nitrospirota bacterium]
MSARILIIDDEEGIRFTFRKFLSAEGYEVSAAESFDQAVDCISTTDFDLIFADIILKGKTGIDVLREIKKRNINCPVIMITGYPNIDTASEAVRLGAFDYIPKPIQKDALFHAIDVALQHKKVIDEKDKYRSNLEAIFRSVKDAIITVDKDLVLLEINEAAGDICGFTRNAIGKVFSSLHHGCKGKCLEALVETVNTKQPAELNRIECRVNNRKGQIAAVTTSPLLNSQGIFSGAVMVVKDETRLTGLERELNERRQFHRIIGKSERMQEVYSMIDLLTDVETTVLITGESGTGKELVAEALHYKGNRSPNSLVKVNCSALSENLLESELFGHVRGSFTGAIKDKTGRFQLADGGTIFLDEIADISPKIQIELLRILEEKEFERVGDSTTIKVDVRVVTATNQDLSNKVKLGEFREDLYYRLNVMKIMLPPLRERRDDIPLLINYFLKKFNKKFDKEIRAVSTDVEKIFMQYPWPGNIRELEHSLEHAFILCRQLTLAIEHLPIELQTYQPDNIPSPNNGNADDPQAILQALEKTGWNKTKAASLLGISRRSIYRKIKEFNITPQKR